MKERKVLEAVGPAGGAVAVGPSSPPRRWQTKTVTEVLNPQHSNLSFWRLLILCYVFFANLDCSGVKILTIVRLLSTQLW